MCLLLQMKRFLVFLAVCCVCVSAMSQPVRATTRDLEDIWKVSKDRALVPYEGETTRSIHFSLSSEAKGTQLVIEDRREFTILINGQLMARTVGRVQWDVDSLFKQHKESLFFSVFQSQKIYYLKTYLLLSTPISEWDNPIRTGIYFKDFSIVASLILFVFLVVLFQMNPRLAIDYLNVVKLFSVQERDEPTVASRIGSSINLLFFGWVSFLYGFLLLVVFYFASDRLVVAKNFMFDSVSQGLLHWVILSLIILVVLVLKLILIASLSTLFVLRSTVRFQFFNFVRQLFVSAALVGVLSSFYFIFGTSGVNSFYYLLVLNIILMWVGLLFLFFKLIARTSPPIFHLFSYLCVSEIIPLMILVKVLLF